MIKHAVVRRNEIADVVNGIIAEARPAWENGSMTVKRKFVKEVIKPLVDKYSPLAGRGQQIAKEMFHRVRDELLLHGYSDIDVYGYTTGSFTKW